MEQAVEGFFAVSCNVGLRGGNYKILLHTAAFRRWVVDKKEIKEERGGELME